MPGSTRRAPTGAPRRGAPAARRRERGSLSEAEILDGALAVVAERGLAGLSMPALARRLGSGVTSIYWYFRSKDDLLAALADRVAGDVHGQLPPLAEGPWHEVLVEHLLAVRQLLEDNRWHRELLVRGYLLGPATPDMFAEPEAAVALVAAAGLDRRAAADAVEAMAGYTRGFIVLEHRLEGDETTEETQERLRHIPADAYPTLGRLRDFLEVGWLDHEQCRFGLGLLADGIKARHGA